VTDQIPPLPEPPILPPPPQGFERAWSTGTTTRRRRLAVVGGVAAAVIGISTVAYTTSFVSASDTLTPARNGVQGSPLPHLSPSPAPGLPAQIGPSNLPHPLPGLPRTASPSPGAAGPNAADGAGGSSDAAARPPSRPIKRVYHSPTPHADTQGVDGGSFTLCSASAIRNAESWCGHAGFSDGPAHDVTLDQSLCRNQNGPQSSLAFASSQEVDLEILTTSGKRIWRWSDGLVFTAKRHALPVEPGGCYDWITTWTPQLPNGDRLPAGDYVLRTHVTALDKDASSAFTTTFTY
jgi:hypothetical protein